MSLATNLVYNNRFATKKINAEQVGAETASAWTLAIKVLHRSAYAVYEYCENNGLRIDDNSINKNEVFEDLKRILTKIGDVNGRKLYANETAVNLIIGYAGKRANKDSDELKDVLADIREKKKATEEAEGEELETLNAELDELEERKKALIEAPDNRFKQATITSDNAFRLEVEHLCARAIIEQNAKSLAELDAEDAARDAARKAKNKARKAAKRLAEKAAKAAEAEATANA